MKLLLPNQPLPDESRESKPRGKRTAGATVSASFNLPGNVCISKSGKGSNFRRATLNAINKIFTDDRLKGKRATSIAPVRLTVNYYEATSDE